MVAAPALAAAVCFAIVTGAELHVSLPEPEAATEVPEPAV
jgi:hypothetical protein